MPYIANNAARTAKTLCAISHAIPFGLGCAVICDIRPLDLKRQVDEVKVTAWLVMLWRLD